MASTSETGHAKNVANFEDLISFCTGYGTAYNPSKAAIQLPALNTLYSNAQNALAGLISSKIVFDNATNARQAAFEPLKKLATRIVNALDATEATDALLKDARTINSKIQGKRSGKLTKADSGITADETVETAKTISVSQQSFDSLIENFAKLIELVSSEPSYTPNETELQVSTLTTTLGDLKAKNTEVVNSYTNYSNARITRDSILYATNNGLVDTALEVKKYVKSVFGATSPQFKQVSGLEFKKRKK